MSCYLCFRWPCYYCDERGVYLHVHSSLITIITYESPFTSFCGIMMAAILGKLLTKNRQFQMLITFEPFIRFLQMKAQKSS
jgi:hypothetical protein